MSLRENAFHEVHLIAVKELARLTCESRSWKLRFGRPQGVAVLPLTDALTCVPPVTDSRGTL
jgi:hypothetical protein